MKNIKLDRGPLWRGPETDGVTFSLLSRFLGCRERFRVHVIEGLRATPTFSPAMEYGTMWHVCEEAHGLDPKSMDWYRALNVHAAKLMDEFPHDREKVVHWREMCATQFPEYVKFWKGHREERKRVPLFREEAFTVPYTLPWSKRTVLLRGKWDGGDVIEGNGHLAENKTKSQINPEKVQQQLTFDLQTMLYLVAARAVGRFGDVPLSGVRYNVVRRSAHKSSASMLTKLREDVGDGRGGEWFARWTVAVSDRDVEVFKKTCLDPILESLCVWYDIVTGSNVALGPYMTLRLNSFRFPYGVYNPVVEGGVGEVDTYLTTGSKVGLKRMTTLFPELEG